MHPFLILHLSDAHIGNPKYELDAFDVFESLFVDLRQMRQELGRPPDLIVFNGDLAYGEIPNSSLVNQYEQATKWLDRVYQEIGSAPKFSPILFVPGNHDINRKVITDDQTSWIETRTVDNLYELMRDKSLQWQRYLERQQDWAVFVESYAPEAFTFDRTMNTFSGVLVHRGIRIGIAGLNTSWASHQQHESGKLWLGKYQLQNANALLSTCDFRIGATHHPVRWLHHSEATEAEQKIQSQFHLHLHGHVHDHWFVPAEGHLRVQAGAAYAGSEKQNGYSWIEIDFVSRKAILHLRTYTDAGKGGWISFQIPGKTDHAGIASVTALFLGSGETIPTGETPTVAMESDSSSTIKEVAPKVAETNVSDSAQPQALSAAASIPLYVEVLENSFSFRWEPGGYDMANASATIVYWPVRLRKPTVIHAVQAYASAGLQRLGAEIVLCLDDLGNAEGSVSAFSDRVSRWLGNAAGDPGRLQIRTFGEIVTRERYVAAWELLQGWLADARYQLKDILAISKIWPRDSDLSGFAALLSRKPRRLLTPALVWTCLVHLLDENPDHQIITLGGYDERPLWDAWRDGIKKSFPVGHLYVPELTHSDTVNTQLAVHMARPDTNLSWDSREDIRYSLRDAFSTEDWFESGRLLPWVLAGAVRLPRYLNGLPSDIVVRGSLIRNITDLSNIDKPTLISSIESEVSRYIF
jgi:predicted MPP superfamily phosphohydrolase